ncbi:hypothetical protein HBB16_16960 [Pseudonocardia sp. MCCB 268]|nr:hypothetical protein [Pseudonocardia cytotoxica]
MSTLQHGGSNDQAGRPLATGTTLAASVTAGLTVRAGVSTLRLAGPARPGGTCGTTGTRRGHRPGSARSACGVAGTLRGHRRDAGRTWVRVSPAGRRHQAPMQARWRRAPMRARYRWARMRAHHRRRCGRGATGRGSGEVPLVLMWARCRRACRWGGRGSPCTRDRDPCPAADVSFAVPGRIHRPGGGGCFAARDRRARFVAEARSELAPGPAGRVAACSNFPRRPRAGRWFGVPGRLGRGSRARVGAPGRAGGPRRWRGAGRRARVTAPGPGDGRRAASPGGPGDAWGVSTSAVAATVSRSRIRCRRHRVLGGPAGRGLTLGHDGLPSALPSIRGPHAPGGGPGRGQR